MSQPAADHAVVGASDLRRTAEFFEAFGFTARDQRRLDAEVAAALYGLEAATDELVLAVPGAATGRLRIVATPLPLPDRGHFHRGGHALDLYSTDVAASVEVARRTGAVVGPIADYPFGPVHLQQAQAMGPDDVPLVFVGIDKRLPSVLDARPDLLHSELHSIVASVDGIDAETAFWVEVVGLEQQSAFPIDVPAVSDFMMLPHHVPVRMSVLRGPGAQPPRFELLEFQGAEGVYVPGRPLLPGNTHVCLVVDAIEPLLDRVVAAGAVAGAVVTAPGVDGGEQRAATFTSPGGVEAEVREPAA